jgi:serine O-acetyltransferase
MSRAFAEDLKRWKDRSVRPVGASASSLSLGVRDILGLLLRHPAVCATGVYRMASWCSRHHVRLLPTLFEWVNLLWFGIEIGSGVEIGPGLYIAHPSGTVIFARQIGANATFIHAVTLGMRNTWEFPTLGNGVFVGAGARILGGVHLGDDCSVGANAVVIDDVPSGATAMGVPARIQAPRRMAGAAALHEVEV